MKQLHVILKSTTAITFFQECISMRRWKRPPEFLLPCNELNVGLRQHFLFYTGKYKERSWLIFLPKGLPSVQECDATMMSQIAKAGYKKIINSLILRGKKILQSTWYDFSDLIIELFSSLLNHISWKKNITNQRSIARKAPEYWMHR